MTDLVDTFDAAEQLLCELEWYALREKDLSDPAPGYGEGTWGEMMRGEIDELRACLAKIKAASHVEGGRDD